MVSSQRACGSSLGFLYWLLNDVIMGIARQGRITVGNKTREGTPAWCFSVVVVRQGDRFLLVQERKHDQLWYLPAGKVEPGESFAQAAVRETLEESGVHVRLTGVIRFDLGRNPLGRRFRAIFLGEPAGDPTPKDFADKHSLQAKWVAPAELGQYPLRGADVSQLIEYVVSGKVIYPLEVFGQEGLPY